MTAGYVRIPMMGDSTKEGRTGVFEKIAPTVAKKMSKALNSLTGTKVDVGLGGFNASEIEGACTPRLVDAQETCFGSYMKISESLSGVAVVFFPTRSISKIIKSIQKRRFGSKMISHEMELSAFKELAGTLIRVYLTELSTALKAGPDKTPPKPIHFKKTGPAESADLKSGIPPSGMVSIGRLNIRFKGEPADRNYRGGGRADRHRGASAVF